MSRKKTVLVTGGSGLLGKAIREIVETDKRHGQEQWVFLSSMDANLICPAETKTIFEKHKPSHVIHLAAKVSGKVKNATTNLELLLDNMSINENVLHNCFTFGVKKVISCLSTCAFPNKMCNSDQFDESTLHNGYPLEQDFGYSFSKRVLDILNRAYFDQHRCTFTSAVFENIFGPHDNFSDQNDGPVIAGLIQRTLDAERNNTPLNICDSGKPVQPFIYSKDAARLLLLMLDKYDEIEPIILCGDEKDELTMMEATFAILRVFDYTGQVAFFEKNTEGPCRRTASNAKMRRYLPHFQFTPFEDAIADTVHCFKEHRKAEDIKSLSRS